MEHFLGRHSLNGDTPTDVKKVEATFKLKVLSQNGDEIEVESGLTSNKGVPIPIFLASNKIINIDTLEEDHNSSSTQFDLPRVQADALRVLQSQIDKSDLSEKHGLEKDPHVTMLCNITDTKAWDKIRKIMIKESKPWAKIASIGVFSSSSEYDVLYLGIDSPDLMDIREKLESAVESVQTHPKYNPHATIAYLKKGTSSKYTSLEVPTMTFRLDKFFFSRKDARKILIPMSGIDKSKRIFLST